MASDLEKQKRYWLQQLAEPPPCPDLPWDAERPPVSSYIREQLLTRIESGAWFEIRELAARLGPEAVLLAGIQILLFRYTGQPDLIVGTSSSGGVSGQIQLVPLRARLAPHLKAQEVLLQAAAALGEAAENAGLWARTDLIQEFQTNAEPLFNVALLFSESASDLRFPQATAKALANCALVLRTRTAEDGLNLHWEYDAERLSESTVRRITGHLGCLLSAMAKEPRASVDRLSLLEPGEKRQILVEWNATETEIPAECIHRQIEAQAARTPSRAAVLCRDRQLTYAELNARANQVASRLTGLGVGPEDVVGLCVERSLEMVVGLLGILKAGAAYLPLDPAYPSERIALLIEDAQLKVILAQESVKKLLPGSGAKLLPLESDWLEFADEPVDNVERGVTPEHLAYLLYTSGSTGKPKGVMVEHRNVVNFFAGMDTRIRYGSEATWLAATSLSFDISVLELFWTLAHGFKVVLFADGPEGLSSSSWQKQAVEQPMEFSLFYFSSEQTGGAGGPYRLLTEGARFADERGFVAVWTPERHFHEFGGLYPNPSVTSAALAMITQRVQIRSGSVVAPLHSPIRIAEEWSVVDNLSNGRAAISFASGWMPEDFALNPGNYRERKEITARYIEIVRRLWRGEAVAMPGPLGKEVQVKILPRPVQRELPVWLTAAGNPETFQMAGRLGLKLLTHLLGQPLEEVSAKISLYRQAWQQAGHPGRGHVTLMLHTFLGDSLEEVKAAVRRPLIEYLRKSADLIKGYTWAFSAFKHAPNAKGEIDFSTLATEEMDALLEHAFERYFGTSGLFGTPESCRARVDALRAAGVDEIACLIDFGIDADLVLKHLEHLDCLRKAAGGHAESESAPAGYSIPALIERHGVTHFQCTPSMASVLLLDERARRALGGLQCLLVGGEMFPPALARQLRTIVQGDLLNMYGPTETTIWSSAYLVPPEPERIPVGRPIANTQMYVVDQNFLPVPVGVTGELLIGGAGVARGYFGRPELTAEKFVPSPFASETTSRLYRTGDLARFLPDGNIELLGRMDHQVKIRGHRVELGEIETRLNEHPDVRESVVVPQETADGHKQLVAFVIPWEGKKPVPNQLRYHVQHKLPEHMLPARIVFLTSFPQTPNRKIDRKALAAMKPPEGTIEREFEPPSTALEKALAEYWRELLNVQRVSRHDNFFDLGGNSLLAMHLAAWVRERCKVDLPLRSLFEHPAVSDLAAEIEALAWSAPAPELAYDSEREEVEI